MSEKKFRVLDELEKRVCKENGISTERVSVEHRAEGRIILFNNETGDNISIHKSIPRRGREDWS